MLWFLGELTLYRLLKCPVKKSKIGPQFVAFLRFSRCRRTLSLSGGGLVPSSLVHAADQLILSAPSTTVATETLRVCVVFFFARVLLLGIGCWGRDAFQSNLLLGCGSPPSPRAEERGCRWRSPVLMMFGQHGAPCHGHHFAALQGKY